MILTTRNIFCLCFLFHFAIVSENTFAQKFLGLDKGGRIKRIHFYPGDVMHVKLKGTHQYITGELQRVGDTIVIEGNKMLLSQINKVKVHSDKGISALLASGSIVLPAAAVLFLFTGAFNSVTQNESPLITEGNAKLSGGLVLTALLFHKMTKRVFKIGNRHPLKVIDVSIY